MTNDHLQGIAHTDGEEEEEEEEEAE